MRPGKLILNTYVQIGMDDSELKIFYTAKEVTKWKDNL